MSPKDALTWGKRRGGHGEPLLPPLAVASAALRGLNGILEPSVLALQSLWILSGFFSFRHSASL